ncbi:MAG: ATP-binding protein [Bacteroidota bacterium]|nr:ATP-binding protein [Bacteroidota bacterium]
MTRLISINNDCDGYQQLIDFYNEHKDKFFEDIPLELTYWFSANMCSALGGILDLLMNNLNDIKFDKISSGIERILLKNDFLSYYGFQSLYDDYHTTIRYMKLKPGDGKYFNHYIYQEVLSRNELPQMSQLVKEKMTEAIYEIFVNAQIHSESNFIYTCGQFYPNKNLIEFTITDTGIGFKRKINERFNSRLSSIQAIKWAIQDGKTTKTDMSGGLGLTLLKEFIEKNKGKMQIISDDGFYQYDTQGEQINTFSGSFPGTIVNLQFKTDDNSSYYLTQEINSSNIF